jgi:drug/metabolite transporter (DMT)-like permease
MYKKRNNIGLLYVLASAVLFSLGGVLIKSITWSSITINGIRNLFAFMVMFLYLKKINHKIVINKMVIWGAVCNLLMNLTFVMATKLTSAANAIVLQFTAPIFLILYIWMIWKKKPDKNAVITCFFVFMGILCFFFDKISFGGQAGNLIAILSGALYAVIFMLKKIENADFESSILISQLASFIIFIPWYFKETDFHSSNFLLILILGVIQMGAAYICLAKGLDLVTPVTASLASTIEPILNPIWVAMFYGEIISPIAIAGAAVVIISSTVYNIKNTLKKLNGT